MRKYKVSIRILLILLLSIFTYRIYAYVIDKLNSNINIFNGSFQSDRQIIKYCPSLQNSIISLLKGDIENWSLTVLNENSDIISEIAGTQSRIPASNQKLFTTAYDVPIIQAILYVS